MNSQITLGEIFECIQNNNLERLLWIHENARPCMFLAIDHFAKNGNLEAIKWVKENVKDFKFIDARREYRKMIFLEADDAISSDEKLEIRKNWSLEQDYDFSAYQKYLCEIEQMHYNYYDFDRNGEFCTVMALYNAVDQGHLDVLKWLYENAAFLWRPIDRYRNMKIQPSQTQDSPTSFIMTVAARKGHAHILQYLIENKKEKVSLVALDLFIAAKKIANKKDFEFFKTTFDQYLTENTISVDDIMDLLDQVITHTGDNVDMFQLVYSKLSSPLSDHYFYEILMKAITTSSHKIAEWIFDQNPHFQNICPETKKRVTNCFKNYQRVYDYFYENT